MTQPVQTKEQVLTRLLEHQVELRRFGVRRCGVFGSFVRNAPHDQSDVDILVEFEPGQKTFYQICPELTQKRYTSPSDAPPGAAREGRV